MTHTIELLKKSIKTQGGVFQVAADSKLQLSNFLLLSIYRNNIVSMFAVEALVLAAVKAAGANASTRDAYAVFEFLAQVFRYEFVSVSVHQMGELEPKFVMGLERLVDAGLVEVGAGGESVALVAEPKGEGKLLRELFESMTAPFAEAYWIAIFALQALLPPAKPVPTKAFAAHMQWMAGLLYDDGLLSFYEATSKETLSNAAQYMLHAKILVKSKQGTLALAPEWADEGKLRALLARVSTFGGPKLDNNHPVRRNNMSSFAARM